MNKLLLVIILFIIEVAGVAGILIILGKAIYAGIFLPEWTIIVSIVMFAGGASGLAIVSAYNCDKKTRK